MKLIIEKNPEKRLSEFEKKIKMGKGFVYHQSSQPFYRIKILVKNLESEPEVYVNKIEKRIYKIDQLIRFLKLIEKANKGIARLHAAAVANKEKEGLIFCGWQDTGKTTLSFLLAKKGYFLLGDDGIELSQDGTIFRIQKKAGIFPCKNNLKDLPLTLKEKTLAWFKYHFIKFTFLHRFIYPNLRVDYKKIGKVLDKAELKKIFILEKGKPEIQKIDINFAINKYLSTTFDTLAIPPSGFPKTLFYMYYFANNLPSDFLIKKYEKILENAFRGKEAFLIRGKTPLDFHKILLDNEKR
jgi:hypothetical protein